MKKNICNLCEAKPKCPNKEKKKSKKPYFHLNFFCTKKSFRVIAECNFPSVKGLGKMVSILFSVCFILGIVLQFQV